MNENGRRVVFVVENDEPTINLYSRSRRYIPQLSNIEMIFAKRIQNAWELFQQNQRAIDIIVMDACLETHEPDTIELTRKIRELFQGRMIATSSNEQFVGLLRNAGCDCDCSKGHIPDMLLRITLCGQP